MDDVRIDQIRHKLGFADEVLDELLLVGVVLANHLDRDPLHEFTRAVLLGFIDDSHAAFEYLAHDLVAKLVLNGEEGHASMLVKRGLMSSPWCGRADRGRGGERPRAPIFPENIIIFYLHACGKRR